MSEIVPYGWGLFRQGDICEFSNGRAYKLTEWEKKGTPVIRLQNLTGSGKEFYFSNLELPERQYCFEGDLLYMWSATFGPHIWKGPKAIYHYHIWKVIPDEIHFTKKYSYHLLAYKTDEWLNKSNGMGILHVTKGSMEELSVMLPPLPEQKKIAAILSSVDEMIEKIQAQIDKLKDLKTGMMQELLTRGIGHTEFKDSPVGRIPDGWEIKTLGELAAFNSGYAFKSIELSEDGYKVVRISNLHKPNFPYWRYDGDIKDTWLVQKGDVLFSWAGVANSINVHHYMGETALLNQHIYNFKFESDEIKLWTYQILKSLLPELKRRIEGGAGQLHLTKSFIQGIAIPFPSISERMKIGGCLKEIDARLSSILAKKTKCEELKKALMQDLLTGKVRVKVED